VGKKRDKSRSEIEVCKEGKYLLLPAWTVSAAVSVSLVVEGAGNRDSVLVPLNGQFITPSVHLCQQHDASEAARRAGPSATEERP